MQLVSESDKLLRDRITSEVTLQVLDEKIRVALVEDGWRVDGDKVSIEMSEPLFKLWDDLKIFGFTIRPSQLFNLEFISTIKEGMERNFPEYYVKHLEAFEEIERKIPN